MRIDRIEASKHKRGRVLVFLADGSLLKVTEQELLTFGLRSGDELDEETLTRLKEAAGVSNIKTTAADLVGRRAMSRRDLEKKLQEKGASETEARYAGEWLEAIGALDDDTLFYFESRGFDRDAAERLMARAAVERLAHDLGDDATAETVQHELNGGM